MTEKVTFKFFEGRDVDQFTFYRIPKQLFTVSYFKSLSSDAKILYGLMLDRISLSVKNQWFDEENRAYIYFSIDDVMELLGVGKNKAVKCLKELDVETGIGLTQKRRQGFGKSNMIYVKTFLVESQADYNSISRCVDEGSYRKSYASAGPDRDQKDVGNGQKQTSAGVNEVLRNTTEQTSLQNPEGMGTVTKPGEKGPSDMEMDVYDLIQGKNSHISSEKTRDSDYAGNIAEPNGNTEKFDNQTNGEKKPDTEVYFSNIKKFKNQTSRSPENKLQEVYISNPNKTEYNKTEYSYNKSYLIVSGNGDSLPIDPGMGDAMRYDEKQTDSGTGERAGTGHETGAIYALVRKNIDLDGLLAARQADHDLILEICSLIVEMVSCRSKEIVIASSRYPADLVRNRFLKLGYDHINYVIDCLDKNTTKVKNIRKYLLAALFNAPATIDGYYRSEVRHDMEQFRAETMV